VFAVAICAPSAIEGGREDHDEAHSVGRRGGLACNRVSAERDNRNCRLDGRYNRDG
jgi:hypothetical protein